MTMGKNIDTGKDRLFFTGDMDNNLMNVDLPRLAPPAPRNFLNDRTLPLVDDSDIPAAHTLEIERITSSCDNYSWRYIIITSLVGFFLAILAGVFVPSLLLELGIQDHNIEISKNIRPTMVALIGFTQLAILLAGTLFNLYLYKVLVRPRDYVLEMERVTPGSYAAPTWIEDDTDPWIQAAPLHTASSLLSTWRARIVSVRFNNGAYVSTPLVTGPRRDSIVEESRLGRLLFAHDDTTMYYEPIPFQLDDRLPTELMIPKIHQLGIDPQLLATRVNQAANSIDMSCPSNAQRKSALMQARTVSNAPDPWSTTVAAVTADIQSKTRVGDGISAFLTAQ